MKKNKFSFKEACKNIHSMENSNEKNPVKRKELEFAKDELYKSIYKNAENSGLIGKIKHTFWSIWYTNNK